jgi:hypothetical protein
VLEGSNIVDRVFKMPRATTGSSTFGSWVLGAGMFAHVDSWVGISMLETQASPIGISKCTEILQSTDRRHRSAVAAGGCHFAHAAAAAAAAGTNPWNAMTAAHDQAVGGGSSSKFEQHKFGTFFGILYEVRGLAHWMMMTGLGKLRKGQFIVGESSVGRDMILLEDSGKFWHVTGLLKFPDFLHIV